MQMREGLNKVLGDFVRREALTIPQAIAIVEAILFKTSNQLYQLNLDLRPLPSSTSSDGPTPSRKLQSFLGEHPSVQYLRLQWLDYTSTLRVRILPIKQAAKMLEEKRFIGIAKAVLGLLQQDLSAPGFSATGEYSLCPQFASLRLGNRYNNAFLQCEFQEKNGDEVSICPRTVLRKQVQKAEANSMTFLIGFEIEVVFMRVDSSSDKPIYTDHPVNAGGHAWSTSRALQNDKMLDMLESMLATFETTGIEVQQFHSECSAGQYEFVLAPLPPLQAVDTLLAAREIISSFAANSDLRATLIPKPSPQSCGTGAHLHISIEPADQWKSFYAGVLKHLKAIAAFTYSNAASYERVQDGVWAGGTWVCWGSQNRETPLRRIEASHFEIKCMDGLANPYLALAAIIGAGVQSVLDGESMTLKDCVDDPAKLSPTQRTALGICQNLPRSIEEALECLRNDLQLGEILGEAVVRTYRTVKEAEGAILKAMEPEERRRWLIERY